MLETTTDIGNSEVLRVIKLSAAAAAGEAEPDAGKQCILGVSGCTSLLPRMVNGAGGQRRMFCKGDTLSSAQPCRDKLAFGLICGVACCGDADGADAVGDFVDPTLSPPSSALPPNTSGTAVRWKTIKGIASALNLNDLGGAWKGAASMLKRKSCCAKD